MNWNTRKISRLAFRVKRIALAEVHQFESRGAAKGVSFDQSRNNVRSLSYR